LITAESGEEQSFSVWGHRNALAMIPRQCLRVGVAGSQFPHAEPLANSGPEAGFAVGAEIHCVIIAGWGVIHRLPDCLTGGHVPELSLSLTLDYDASAIRSHHETTHRTWGTQWLPQSHSGRRVPPGNGTVVGRREQLAPVRAVRNHTDLVRVQE